ncbi:hypothetical protein V8C86DRAFT_3124619 [Haematococcus lacustris]
MHRHVRPGPGPPDTWEQLLQLATNTSLWSAQDFNSSSTDLGQDGTPSSLMAQYTGAAQGLHFDPLTMQPLVTSPAMTEAVRL